MSRGLNTSRTLIFEIATHICAADKLGVPSSYAEAFAMLGKAGILDLKLTDDLKAMARLRNRIVHFYWEVGGEEVYAILQGRLEDFVRYLRAIELYLSRGEGSARPQQR